MKTLSIGACVALLAMAGGCGPADVDGRGGTLTIGTAVQGTITPADPAITVPGRSGTTMYATDIWTVSLTMGMPVTISMCENAGSDFDPYLTVESMGMDNHSNDDSGGGYHGHGSLLTFTPTVTGTYTVYASTWRSGDALNAGDYTLQVQNGDMSSTFHCPM